jgi:hypothetical protein
MKRVAAVIFHAPLGETVGERLVEDGRWASTRNLSESLQRSGVSRTVILTDSAPPSFLGDLPERLPLSSQERRGFHFGAALQRLISELELDGVLYFGSGSGGLLNESQLARLADFAASRPHGALFNNFYSCDFAALANARELLRFDLPATDNPLGFRLADAGIPCYSLPRAAETQFDIDTPADVHLLAAARPERLGREWPETDRHPSLHAALSVLTDRSATTCLIGRTNPTTWSQFEREVACRTSGLVEGRGMRSAASGRTPWLRQALLEDGAEAFFSRLEGAANAAWIDSRPLLSDPERTPPADDRFASDLFRWDQIADPLWRSFTEAATRCEIPVVLGGHNLLCGGLYLAAEACWKGRNLLRRLHPEPFEW